MGFKLFFLFGYIKVAVMRFGGVYFRELNCVVEDTMGSEK